MDKMSDLFIGQETSSIGFSGYLTGLKFNLAICPGLSINLRNNLLPYYDNMAISHVAFKQVIWPVKYPEHTNPQCLLKLILLKINNAQ